MTTAEEALGSQEPKAGYPRAESAEEPRLTHKAVRDALDALKDDLDAEHEKELALLNEQLSDIRRALGCPAHETTVRWAEKCGERLRAAKDDGK